MAPKKKSKEDKAKENLAKLLGIDMPTGEEAIQDAREQEAVIAHVKHPKDFIEKDCENCKKKFAVNRMNVSYCSDRCREKTLKKMGLSLTRNPRNAWDKEWVWDVYWGNEPLIVPPDALEVLKKREADLESRSEYGRVTVSRETIHRAEVITGEKFIEPLGKFSDLSKEIAEFSISSSKTSSEEVTDFTKEVGEVTNVNSSTEIDLEAIKRLLGN